MIEPKHIITSYAHIKHNQIVVNGNLVYVSDKVKLLDFLAEAYKTAEMNYSKFHKMDLQCKLGLLCAEFALKNSNIFERHKLSETAIILSNKASSIETDRNYQSSISDKSNYFPSPSVFVYTLPNIVIGEIAIKYKITGENTFFVSESIDAELLVDYTCNLLNEGVSAAICGWIEVDGPYYEAFIYLVESEKNINKNSIFKPLNKINVIDLYKQNIWKL